MAYYDTGPLSPPSPVIRRDALDTLLRGVGLRPTPPATDDDEKPARPASQDPR